MVVTLSTVAMIFGVGAASRLVLDAATRPRRAPPQQQRRIARRHQALVPAAARPTPAPPQLSGDAAEAALARAVPLAGLGLASAVAGLSAPVLALPAVLVGGYLSIPFLHDGVRKFRRNRHLIDLVDAALLPLLVLLNQIIAVALILFLMSVSRRLLARTYDRSRCSLVGVFGVLPKRVWVAVDGTEVEVEYRDLAAGDIVVVTAGEAIPIDGVIVDGDGLVDQHVLTGEAVPVEKRVGDRMLAATLVVSGRFLVRVERAGSATHAGEVARLVLAAADRRLKVQERGEAIAEQCLVPMILLAGVAGVIGGPVRAITVYMVTPGYTMRVLAPLALLRALRRGAEGGLLIKDGRSLELLQTIDTVVFDKTGTLTDGSLRMERVVAVDGAADTTVLAVAAAAEGRQSHPIARAVRAAADAAGVVVPPLDDSDYTLGRGIRARVAGQAVLVGSRSFLADHQVTIPPAAADAADAASADGMTAILVAIDGRTAGVIVLDQAVRPEAAATVAALRRRGLATVILSGDGRAATRHLARRCGIDTVYAETLPADKAAVIRAMRAQGRRVCYVGDGINDAGALAEADVSVSIRGASTIATDAAQVVLLTADLRLILDLLEVAGRYDRATGFAARFAVGLPLAVLPLILFGAGGLLLLIAAHQVAFWSGLVRILKSNRLPAPGDPADHRRIAR